MRFDSHRRSLWIPLLAFLLASRAQANIHDLRVLSDRWICVVHDQYAAIDQDRDQDTGLDTYLKQYWESGNVGEWKLDEVAEAAAAGSIKRLRPAFLAAVDNPASYAVTLGGQAATVSQASHWSAPTESLRWQGVAPYPTPHGYKNSKMTRVLDFAYLQLATPITQGKEIKVTFQGETRSVAFDEKSTVAWSIKVNQTAYVLRSGAKRYAYLGMWLGPFGSLDFASFAGRAFQVYPYAKGADRYTGKATGSPVFTGTLALRRLASAQVRTSTLEPVTGEDVYEMDFSGLSTPGEYVVVVPGLGRSWPFRLEANATAEPFYHSMRALFHQRAGKPVPEANSPWGRPATHTQVYRAAFLPRHDWYFGTGYQGVAAGAVAQYGFREAGTNKAVAVDSFDHVKATVTTELLPNIRGGWWDAADYDRRPQHFEAVYSLLGAYELFPQNFSDSQLNIPESGNGIPDIIDIALDMVEMCRSSQDATGAVRAWVEATAHPQHYNKPQDDPLTYYASLPMRHTNAEYSATAALASRLIKPFDAAKAQQLLDSALLAYTWANNPANRIQNLQFTSNGKALVFDEKPETPDIELMNARLQLWFTTGVAAYGDLFRNTPVKVNGNTVQGMGAIRSWISAGPDENHFTYASVIKYKDWLTSSEWTTFVTEIKDSCSLFLTGLEESAYRHYFRPKDHGYYQNMSWGEVHPVNRAATPLLAWLVTQDPKYLDAVERSVDWDLGANPMGRSQTTGLGTIFPVVLQHISSETDSIPEPVPGLTPFMFTYGIDYYAGFQQFGYIDSGVGAALCFLAPQFGSTLQSQVQAAASDSARATLLRDAVVKKYPILRRNFTHYTLSPKQNEFTVHESVAGAAAVYGALLNPGWKPGSRELDRQPIPSDKLPVVYQP